jgi:hypothetical protein
MSRAALVIGIALASLCAGACAPKREAEASQLTLREASFRNELLHSGARLTVMFWPASGSCSTVEFGLVETLNQFRAQFPDTAMISVVPEGKQFEKSYGLPLPGALHVLARNNWLQERERSPFPRIEVWNPEGQLLFLRAISPLGNERTTLATELERTIRLTRPDQGTAKAEKE